MLKYDRAECDKIVETYRESICAKYGRFFTVLDTRPYYEWDPELHACSTPRASTMTTVFPCASFWYINFLTEIRPAEIVDLGCGVNFFKNIIPNIIGVDPNNPYSDIVDIYDSRYLEKHIDTHQALFSIDALHFRPITEFADIVQDFYSMLKKEGRGYLSLNSARLIEFTEKTVLQEIFGNDSPSPKEIENYIDYQIKTKLTNIDFIVTDLLICDIEDEFMDGNIRLVMKK